MPAPPDLYLVPTPDGWALALHRYRHPDPAAPAVALCGGYACNRHFLDFDERYSLARYLAGQGFDAWVVELRGRGRSRPLPACRRPGRWTFDDLALVDLPAVLGFMQREVRHHRIAWVGHSMGGMVLYAGLGAGACEPPPAAAVTIATPITFPAVASRLAQQLGTLLLALPGPSRVPQRPLLGALWHLIGWTRALELGMNPDNVDRAVVGAALRRSMTNVSRDKLRQLAQWAMQGTFASYDGGIDYRARLRRVRTPTLLIAGARDYLASPESVGAAHDLLDTDAKQVLIAGREQVGADYGHVDLVFGRRARDEIYPPIAAWLQQHLSGGGA